MANKYIVSNEPWALAKDPLKSTRLDTVLYNTLECLRLLTLVLQPVMPGAAIKMATGLGLSDGDERVCSFQQGGRWNKLTPGDELQNIDSLFPRLDDNKKDAEISSGEKCRKKKIDSPVKAEEDLLDFDHFKKLDLRVAEIVAAEPIKKSKEVTEIDG